MRIALTLAVFPLGDGLVAFDAEQIATLTFPEGVEGLPLVELSALLDLRRPSPPRSSRVLLPSVGPRRGILLEAPQGVVEVTTDDLYPLPALIRRTACTPAVWGVARVGEALAVLVDLAALD